MKWITKKIPLLVLICFSFFYTDKVINLINNNSPLMKSIKKVKDEYNVQMVDAVIEEDTIIPGMRGLEVNIDKSFNNMKEYNTLIEELLVYNDILPKNKLIENKDKYIIKGNSKKKEVAILLIIDENNINKFKINTNITLFINHNMLTMDNINKLKQNEIYTYGSNGVYNKDILINDNTLINRLSNNLSNYCLSKEKESRVLEVCQSSNMNTVVPSILGGYSNIKNELSNGSIILLNNMNNLDNIIKYIEGKGYKISRLSKLLQE